MKRILSLILAISMLMSFAACGSGDEGEKSCTVTFFTNGGSSIEDVVVPYGQCVSEPATPTNGDMFFAGWFSDRELTKPYAFCNPVYENITIYAKWTRYEGNVSANGSSVDTYLISALNIADDRMTASATVSAPEGCTLLVRFIDEEVYFNENYALTAKRHITPDSLYASVTVPGGTDMGSVTASIVGTLPDYYVAEAVLTDRDTGKEISAPVSFIGHTQRYAKFQNTTIHDFAENDTVLQFTDSETDNFGVLAEDVIIVNAEKIELDRIRDTDINEDENEFVDYISDTYFITGADRRIEIGDKVLLTDGETVYLLIADSIVDDGDMICVNTAVTVDGTENLEEFYQFLKVDHTVTSTAETQEESLRHSGSMLLGKVRKAKNGGSRTIRLNLDKIHFDAAGYTVDGSVKGTISAKLRIEWDIHLLGKSYFRCDFTYTADMDAKLSIIDHPEASGEREEMDLLLGQVEIPFGVPGVAAYAEINAFIGWKSEGGIDLSGGFRTTQGFRYNTKDGYQPIDQKYSRWSLSCEGYAELEFAPMPAVGVQFLHGVVSCEVESAIGVRAEALIVKPEHIDDEFYHACDTCVEGKLYAVLSTDADLEYKVTKKFQGKPIDVQLINAEAFLSDFYVSLQNSADSMFGGKVTFGSGKCPNWIAGAVATEPTEPPYTEPTEPPYTEPTEPPYTEPTLPPYEPPTEPPTESTAPTDPPATEPPVVYSEGLVFMLNSDGESYFVASIGTCTDTDIVIPPEYNGLPVTRIGGSAFSGRKSLTSITIPYSVTSIGEYAFKKCESLLSITIPDGVTIIEDYAFSVCKSLTSITLPDGLTSIGEYVFDGCISLTSIMLPDSVTSIGCYAFSYCKSLTSFTLPDSVTSIGSYTFSNCSSLTSITLPDSLTSIGDNAFQKCESLLSITIPDSVTSIGDYAFDSCGITSIMLPVGVTSIGLRAFSYCRSLTSITIPDGVTSIEGYAFVGCSSLISITLPDSVTSIGEHALSNCAFTSITLPAGVTSIEMRVFNSCESLTSITLPDGVTSIGEYAFHYCESLTSITLPESLTSIGDSAFAYCGSLTSIHFDGTVEQWRAVHKSYWNSYTGKYTVYCTDGQVAKDGTVTYN